MAYKTYPRSPGHNDCLGWLPAAAEVRTEDDEKDNDDDDDEDDDENDAESCGDSFTEAVQQHAKIPAIALGLVVTLASAICKIRVVSF